LTLALKAPPDPIAVRRYIRTHVLREQRGEEVEAEVGGLDQEGAVPGEAGGVLEEEVSEVSDLGVLACRGKGRE